MEEDIRIILQESTNAKAFSEDELIHREEFIKAKEWIRKQIEIATQEIYNAKHLTEEEKKAKKIRLHDTITILGSRGSGKSTFIYSLLTEYKKEDEVIIINIDPTLIEEKGHIFLTILSQIVKEVNKALSKSDCNPESESYRKKKDWLKKLQNLAAGIPSLDKIGPDYEKWQDPEFIMDKGLRSVNAAFNLESDFNELLEMGLEIVNKKAYLIALDDIDIDFQKGWPVLETIRKYLTSPYIITLLSGDLKLFSTAIRKQQWKNFGKALLKNEGEELERMSDYDDLVTEMERQYLQKVMQPQRRIHLTTIQEKINKTGKTNINIYEEECNNIICIRIDEYYDNILRKFGIENTYQKETYRSFLLGLPIRTQIQFLLALKESTFKEAEVTDAFLSDLYEKRVDIGTAKMNIKFLNVTILELLLQEHILEEAYQLQPTTTDGSLNSCLAALSFLFSQRSTDNAYLIFDYFIRIGYIRNLSSFLPYQNEINSTLEPSIDSLCKHSSIFFDRVYRDIMGSMTAYIRAFLSIEKGNKTSWGGTIPIYSTSESAKGKGDLSMRIDFVFKDSPLYKKQIAYIPVSISQPNNKQSSLTTYSLYLLLGAIGEIIKQWGKKRQKKEQEIEQEIEQVNADLAKTFGELSQLRSYAMPNFNYHSVSEDSDESDENIENETKSESKIEDTDSSNLINHLRIWIMRYPKDYAVSPHMLGKISTRLFYALRNLEETEKVDNLGDAMHNRIIILYNTILVEEAREFVNTVLSNDNPRGDIHVFKGNMDSLDLETLKELKLFRWIFSCPLLISFLSNTSDIDNIKKQIDNAGVTRSWDKSIYLDLKKVAILDKKTTNQKVSNANKLSNFYYSKTNIIRTINHLKTNNISYDDFMHQSIDKLISSLKKLFRKSVNNDSIDKARIIISQSDNIEPW